MKVEEKLLNLPCELELDDETGTLVLQKVLRHMPNKRIVALAQWHGKAVIAKCFYHKHAKKHVNHEVTGSKALQAANILTPKLLLSGRSGEIDVVIYQYLYESIELSSFIESPRVNDIAMRSIVVLAQMHQAGLQQMDMHSANFLLKEECIYVLDAASVRCQESPVAIDDALKSLAKLVVCFHIVDRDALRSLFLAYVEARHLLVKEKVFKKFLKALSAVRKSERDNYLKKSYRNCSRVKFLKSFRKRYAYVRHFECDDLNVFLESPERFITEHVLQRLKMGNTCSVFKIKLGHDVAVLKRYNIKGFWHGLKRLFQRTRADKSWYAANLLELYRIKTPEPIAFYEKRLGWFRREAYYLSGFVPGLPLDQFFETKTEADQQVKKVFQRVIALFTQLTRYRIIHGDTKATNFLLHEGDVVVLDLDSMHQVMCKTRFNKELIKDRERFLKNWRDHDLAREGFECLKIKK